MLSAKWARPRLTRVGITASSRIRLALATSRTLSRSMGGWNEALTAECVSDAVAAKALKACCGRSATTAAKLASAGEGCCNGAAQGTAAAVLQAARDPPALCPLAPGPGRVKHAPFAPAPSALHCGGALRCSALPS
jgi:hypothetical protein